jgi:hypothetical protein
MKGYKLVFTSKDKAECAEFRRSRPEFEGNPATARYFFTLAPDGITHQYWESKKINEGRIKPPSVAKQRAAKATRARRRLIMEMVVLLGTSGRVAKDKHTLSDTEWLMEVNRIALEVIKL